MTTIANVTATIGTVWFLLLLRILVHEAGHYLAARWCGLPATRIVVGGGPRLYWGTLPDGTGLRISLYPNVGHVLFPDGAMTSLSKVAKIVAAGPLLETLVVPVVAYLILDLWSALVLLAAALSSFYPRKRTKSGLRNDGRILMLCWRAYRRRSRTPLGVVR